MKISTILVLGAWACLFFSVAQAKKLSKEYKDKVYTAKDDAGKISIMSQRAEDEMAEEVTVEAEITFNQVSVTCNFGIIAKKGGHAGSNDKPFAWMECDGDLKADDGVLEELESIQEELAETAEKECGEAYKQCPPNFAFGMSHYLMSHIQKTGRLPKKMRKRIDVNKAETENRAPQDDDDDRKLVRRRLSTCDDIDNSAYPRSGDANCPQTTTTNPGGNGATCMCPYSGGSKRWSYYDDRNGNKYKWSREYGADSVQCAGRCGATCNSADKEAFVDCFDHDSCVDHLGGSVLGGNADCGDEFNEAADDYIVSYGYCCCTCNWWIGCYC